MFFFLLCSFPLLLLLGCLWQKTTSLPSPVLLWDGPVNHSWRHPDNMYVKISNGTQRRRVTAEPLKVAVALGDSQRSTDGKQTRKQQCGGKRERESETERERERGERKKTNQKLKAKQWRMWVLMMGTGISFSLSVSLFFNLVETPLSGAFGLPGTVPRARSLRSPGTAASLSCSSEASLRSSQASRASRCYPLTQNNCAPILIIFLIPLRIHALHGCN